MKKRRNRLGVISLLLVLLGPNSAVASPGTCKSIGSRVSAVLNIFLALMPNFFFPSEEGVVTGDLGPGFDPWGSSAPPEANSGDLRSGIDPDG